MSLIRQLSLLGAEATPPEPGDLAGLLAGRGLVSRVGDAAQVSIVVDHPWRASVLVAECARRGIAATSVSTASDHVGVRTAYSPQLTALAAVGLGAQLATPRGSSGASYRIVGMRRLDRLAEMIGDPPKQAPPGIWPR